MSKLIFQKSLDSPSGKERLVGSDTAELEKLRRELDRVSRELAETKEYIETMRAQMEDKLKNLSTASPANFEV